MILPVDLAQERCLVTIFLTSLTPRALQVHSTDSLSENLKNTQWRLGVLCHLGGQLDHEISEDLPFDRSPGFILDVELRKLDRPLHHPSSHIGLLQNLLHWQISHHQYREALEVMAQSPRREYNRSRAWYLTSGPCSTLLTKYIGLWIWS